MKKNFIKKLVIGGLITSLCICCCFINVKADTPNLRDIYDNYPSDYSIYGMYDANLDYWEGKTLYFTPLLNLKRVHEITQYNEIDFSITWENQIKTGGQFPFSVIKSNFYGDGDVSYYDTSACYGFRFRSFYLDDLILGIDILTSTNDWLNIYEYYVFGESYSLQSLDFVNSKMLIFGLSDLYDFTITSSTFDISMVNQLNNIYDFEFTGVSQASLTAFASLFLMDTSIQVMSNHLLNEFQYYENQRVTTQLEQRYEQGYQIGYAQGLQDSGNNQYRFPFLTGIFNAVSDVLSIEVFPNIKLSYFVFIPLVLGITGMILWFWRKD